MSSGGKRELMHLCEACADVFEIELVRSMQPVDLPCYTPAAFRETAKACYVCRLLWRLLTPEESDYYSNGGEWDHGEAPFAGHLTSGLLLVNPLNGKIKVESGAPLTHVAFRFNPVQGLPGAAFLSNPNVPL